MEGAEETVLVSDTLFFCHESDSSTIKINASNTVSFIVKNCCFDKCVARIGAGAINIDSNTSTIANCFFFRVESKDSNSGDSPASALLRSKFQTTNYTSATKCKTNTHDNFFINCERSQLCHLNNTHNEISHITFTYTTGVSRSEVSYCNVIHNPSDVGVEYQSSDCDSSSIHHAAFAFNTCRNGQNSLGVIRLWFKGNLEADELYFFQNDELPLSVDERDGNYVSITVGTVYTDAMEFYSVVPSVTISIGTVPVFFGREKAARCLYWITNYRARSNFKVLLQLSYINILCFYFSVHQKTKNFRKKTKGHKIDFMENLRKS